MDAMPQGPNLDDTIRTRSGQTVTVKAGRPLPLGAYLADGGANFSIFSRHATRLDLVLFKSVDDREPWIVVPLDRQVHRSGDVWHAWVSGVRAGYCYSIVADGPFAPESGLRFDRNRPLIDPYATALCCATSRSAVAMPSVSRAEASAFKAVTISGEFDWKGDTRPAHDWSKTVIYETHVRGLTIDPSSGVKRPGTYGGVVEKIPYFKALGVSALELLPVQEFDETLSVAHDPSTGERLRDYWGYNPLAFFAPKAGYAVDPRPGAVVSEFKEMVCALHAADIEVILDVVFNHTAEGGENGPTVSFRGLDNPIYYMLEEDRRRYRDYSGCGNTLNCNHPVVRDLILDCLRYWVIEMHVDGFRFDLASILGRDESGNVANNPPLLERIAQDPILRHVKLIAEAWDVGGAYQVGSFPGRRWSEWNARYRDDVRRFWQGERGMAGYLASRLCGSADIYQRSGKEPLNSINFITCHDGFTLNDLVSYERKHNEANGHGNRDGTDANFACNYGVEGPSGDPEIEQLRLRQIKNLIATLLLSRGVPMFLGGDEFRRTQNGNNNAYCQDNETSWYDWRLLDTNRELVRFTRKMIELRGRYPVLGEERFYTASEVVWFNPAGSYPDWAAGDRSLGCVIPAGPPPGRSLCLLFNADERDVEFRIPHAASVKTWRVAVNTAAASPADIVEQDSDAQSVDSTVGLKARSLVVLTG